MENSITDIFFEQVEQIFKETLKQKPIRYELSKESYGDYYTFRNIAEFKRILDELSRHEYIAFESKNLHHKTKCTCGVYFLYSKDKNILSKFYSNPNEFVTEKKIDEIKQTLILIYCVGFRPPNPESEWIQTLFSNNQCIHIYGYVQKKRIPPSSEVLNKNEMARGNRLQNNESVELKMNSNMDRSSSPNFLNPGVIKQNNYIPDKKYVTFEDFNQFEVRFEDKLSLLEAKFNSLLEAKLNSLLEAKLNSLLEAKLNSLEAKLNSSLEAKLYSLLEAKLKSLDAKLDTLIEAKLDTPYSKDDDDDMMGKIEPE